MIKWLMQEPKRWLTLEECSQLFEIFKDQLQPDEPIPPFETRYPGKLESIINSASQTYDGKLLNPTILAAANCYFNLLIRSQAFINVNKRMEVLFTHYFLWLNGLDFKLSPGEMFFFAVKIAEAGEKGISLEDTKRLADQILRKFCEDLRKDG